MGGDLKLKSTGESFGVPVGYKQDSGKSISIMVIWGTGTLIKQDVTSQLANPEAMTTSWSFWLGEPRSHEGVPAASIKRLKVSSSSCAPAEKAIGHYGGLNIKGRAPVVLP